MIDDASKTIFPKHFDEMWPGRWKNKELFTGEMIPIDYDELKNDKGFRYFLKTLRNQNYWLIEIATNNIIARFSNIEDNLDKEIEKLKK